MAKKTKKVGNRRGVSATTLSKRARVRLLKVGGIKPKKSKHRHQWSEACCTCNNCGYYEQYCHGDECFASRLCSASGKCIIG